MNNPFILNKDAETVLKCIIKRVDGNFDNELELSYRDFKKPEFTNSFINSICHELLRKGHIYPFCESRSDNDYIRLQITHEGYSYFWTKKKANFRFWFPIIISLVALVCTIAHLILDILGVT